MYDVRGGSRRRGDGGARRGEGEGRGEGTAGGKWIGQDKRGERRVRG